MPLLRLIFTGLVLIAGVVGAALLLVIGLVVFFLSRLFGRPATMPRFRASVRTSRPVPPRSPQREEVIDVVATEVKDESARDQPRLNG